MDSYPHIVPKEEPVSDCDVDNESSSDNYSGDKNFEILTEVKDEYSSDEFNSSQGQFDVIEEARYTLLSPLH